MSLLSGIQITPPLFEEIGIENAYHFDGNYKFEFLEQFAFTWINQAIL